MKKLLTIKPTIHYFNGQLISLLIAIVLLGSINFSNAQSIVSINPTFGAIGDTVTITVFGTNTGFTQSDGLMNLTLENGTTTINANPFSAVNDSVATGEFILNTNDCGIFDFSLVSAVDGELFLLDAFDVTCNRELDSLALVDLYNQCNGVNWDNNTNWLTGSIDTWFGVTFSGVADRVSGLNLSGTPINNFGLTGILPSSMNNLTALQTLALDYNNLTEVNLDGLPALSDFDCAFNDLTTLSMTDMPNLLGLNALQNQISNLTIADLPQLGTLDLNDNQLTGSLDLTGFPLLELLNTDNTPLDTLDVSGLTNLTDVSCINNNLMSLNVSGALLLTNLYCSENQLTSLNVSGLSDLNELYCETNNLTSLNLAGTSSLNVLYCEDNQLTNLDISGSLGLTELYCGNNLLTNINIGGTSSLQFLYCAENNLTNLDLSSAFSLEELDCGYNQLTSLNIAFLTSLYFINASYNQLSEIDLSGLASIEEVYVNNNLLEKLDFSVTGNNYLVVLECDSNQITELNLSGINIIEFLTISNNKLSEFGLGGFDEGGTIICHNNQLSFKFLTRILTETAFDPGPSQLTPQNNSEAIYYIEFDVGETLDYSEDEPGSLTQYRWNDENGPITTFFAPEGNINILFTDTMQAGDYFFESINDSFPGDTILGPIYRIGVNDTISDDQSVIPEGELIIDFGPDPGPIADSFATLLISSGAYIIDSCSCGGPVLWGIPDTIEDGLDKYLNFSATRTLAKKNLDAEGGDADFNYEWGDVLPSNDDFPFTWSGTYPSYSNNDPILLSVIDQGIDMTHPDLLPFIWNPLGMNCGIPYSATYSGYLLPDSSTIANGLTEPSDDTGHGTGVAGVIPQAVNDPAFIDIFNERVSGVGQNATLFKAICAVNAAIVEDVSVINMSLGYWGERSGIFEDIIRDAETANVIIVASAGNDSTDLQQFVGTNYGFFPANYTRDTFPNLITTGGYDAQKAPADFSNYCADCVDIAGPSKNIRSSKYNTQTFSWYSGTSFTSPYVSGILASIYSGLGSGTSYEAVIDTFFRDFTTDSSLYNGLVRDQKILDVNPKYLCDFQPITVDDEVSDTNVTLITIDPTQNDCVTLPCSSSITVVQNGNFGNADVLGASNFIEYNLLILDTLVRDTIVYEFCYEACPQAEIECGTATIYIELLNNFSYTISVQDSSCNPIDTGIVVDTFMATNGWDSIVTTTTTLIHANETTVEFFVCDSGEVGVYVDTFMNSSGCDSIATTILTFVPSDSVHIYQASCDPNDVGIEFINLFNQNDCDSVVILTTSLLPSHVDTLLVNSCVAADTGIVVDSFINEFGCDSLIVTVTSFTLQYDVIVEDISCNPAAPGTEEIVLTSSDGCDSMVTITTTYVPVQGDTIYLQSCNPEDAGISYDTLDDSTIPITYSQSSFPNRFISNDNPPFGWAVDSIRITGLPQNAKINDIRLDVDLNHTWIGDLFIWLFSPEGQTLVSVLERPGSPSIPGGCSDDDMVITFDDNAAVTAAQLESICDGNVPWFTGSAQPFNSIEDNFKGQRFNGKWFLVIGDAQGGDDGFLNSWTLNIDYVPVEGCDTVITTITDLLPSYHDTIYTTSCDEEEAGIHIDSFTTVDGCDSIQTYITELLPSYHDTIYTECCACYVLVDSVTTTYESSLGCDSSITQIWIFHPVYDTTIELTTCNENEAGTTIDSLTTIQGCDSVITTNITLLEADSTFILNYSCLPADTGTTVLGLFNQHGCDSIVTTITLLLPSYDITIVGESCEPEDTGTFVMNLETHFGCDSIVTTITTLVASYDTTIYQGSCDPEEVGTSIDTMTAASGCDSIVTYVTELYPSYHDTIYTECCACYVLVDSVTTTYESSLGCDSSITQIWIFHPVYDTTIELTTCDENEAGTTIDSLTTIQGCDSVITTNITLLEADSTFILNYSCLPADTGTTVLGLFNQGGCDSIVTTITLLWPSYDITIVGESCEPEDTGTFVMNLETHFGCDSIVTTITTLVASYDTTIYQGSCDPEEVGTSIDTMTAASGCDSIVTYITNQLPSYNDTAYFYCCDCVWLVDTAVVHETTYQGCDSIWVGIYLTNVSYDSVINLTSCDPDDVGTTIDSLLTSQGCDSIITSITTLFASDSVTINNETCDPDELGTEVFELTNEAGCDSIVTVITALGDDCADCVTPDNLYATNITFFQATLGWDEVPGAIRYQAEGRIKNSPFGITRRRMTPNNQFRTNILFPFLTYQFRVRTDCDDGWTDWSYWEDFTLNPFLFLNTAPLNGIQLYGLPTIDLFDVERIFLVNVEHKANVIQAYYHGEYLTGGQIIVSDITGRQIHLTDFELVPDNSKRIELGKQISDGIYFISLIKNDLILETEKIMLYK